jgi:X-X-X-Leu-X-X-Gly heptad repeat protein
VPRGLAGGALGVLGVWNRLRDRPAETPAVAIPTPDTSSMQPAVRRAIERARAAVEADPASADAWGRYGTVLDAHEMLAEAEPCYRRALALAAGDARWPFLLAYTVEMQGGDSEEVVRNYLAAAALEPAFLAVHYRLGQAYARLGRLEQARGAFERALEIDPNLAITHRGLAQVLLALGQVDAAVEHFERAEASEPGNAEVLAGLSQAYMRQGRQEPARQAAERARSASRGLMLPDPVRNYVKSLGTSSEICLTRALESLRAGRYNAAIKDLEIVEETRTRDADVQELLGRAYSGAGQAEAAEEHYLQALEIDPEQANARAGLGQLQARSGRLASGIEQLRRATELKPDNGTFHAELAGALARAGKNAEALASFERAAALAEPSAGSRLLWGQTLLTSGAYERAAAPFRAVLAAWPDHAEARAGLERARERRAPAR